MGVMHVQVTFKTELEDVHEPRMEPPKKPGSRAPTAAWVEYISQQLDGYGPTPLLVNKFELLGPNHRCRGSTLLPGPRNDYLLSTLATPNCCNRTKIQQISQHAPSHR
jgi:hypothetical protein